MQERHPVMVKPAVVTWGQVWGPPYNHPRGIAVMRRKGQRVRFFDWETGEQLGPEHRNVVPAIIWATMQEGWNDPTIPTRLAEGMRREVAANSKSR